MMESLKKYGVDIISYLFILLFVYAAISKIMDFETFQVQLGQSPILSAYAGLISYGVIATELIIAGLFIFKRTRLVAYYGGYMLMVAFTVYIYLILNFSDYIPCSCGGILEKMGWTEHLIFNVVFVILSIIAVLVTRKSMKGKHFLKLSVSGILSAGLIVILFLQSEATLSKNNPFIRKYLKDFVIEKQAYTLKNNSQYFIGTLNNKLYLGDRLAPLYVTEIDLENYQSQEIKIEIDQDHFPFRTVKVFISPPHFYLVDGTVPVIFKGNMATWQATVLSTDATLYFSKGVISSTDELFVRKQDFKTKQNIIARYDLASNVRQFTSTSLLDKEIDGIFDTDGIPLFDLQQNKFLYVYYYRNQYMVANKNLEVMSRSHTIDTTRLAPLRVITTQQSQQKLLNPNLVANRLAAVGNGLLYINSPKKGQFEDKQVWKQASAVDVYDYNRQLYKGSFYLYNIEREKPTEFLLINNNLYAIIGHQLVVYRLNTKLIQ
ncbi:MAG: hypothetical protein KBS93_09155 [Flavobacteriaceae bacterium]|nr:hypothetical protein [Candidatus Onthonaster equi]